MVIPHQTEIPNVSLVRIPGSGSENTAKPTIYNLGRVSIAANAIPIPRGFPTPTNIFRPPAPYNQRPKRANLSEVSEDQSTTPRAKAPRILKIKNNNITKIAPVTLLAVRIPNKEIQELKEENERLKKENDSIKKQLVLFKQLIRNPARLNSVLRRLEIKAQQDNL